MIFWFSPQILEYCLLPVPFHMIPVVYHTVTDGVVNAISRGFRIGEGFVSNEEVKVFYTAFRCEVARFRRNGRTATSRLSSGPTGSNCSGEDAEINNTRLPLAILYGKEKLTMMDQNCPRSCDRL